MTQEQLGELMGVKRAQISKIESGKSVTFSTIIRAFKAMGVNSANLKNLTQEQLGELMGVKRAQISKIESGKSVTFSTIIRAFKAMGVNSANLDLGSLGKVALW